jgi:PPM family protein phosphatase
MDLEIYGFSDIGLVRPNNEDAYLSLPEIRFFALADGMGGHNAGEVAATEALSSLMSSTSKHMTAKTTSKEFVSILKNAISNANQHVWELGRKHNHFEGMGTTLCILHLMQDSVIYAHLGDSRIYRYRSRELKLLTEDHTQYNFPNRRVLTRAIGTSTNVDPEIASATASGGDIFLLCSDGLTDFVTEQEIEIILKKSRSLKKAVFRLIDTAKEKGSNDNITILMVKIRNAKKDLLRQQCHNTSRP